MFQKKEFHMTDKWISVDDSLPSYIIGNARRLRVLVFWEPTKTVFTLWYGMRFGIKNPEFYEENEWTENNDGEIDEDENSFLGDTLTYNNITHWMPLPQPPKDK